MPEIVGVPEEALKVMRAGAGEFSRRKALQAASELANRRIEALNLYAPQGVQEEFHKCTAKECMFQGGNRAGKSLAAFVEDARAVLGRDPYEKYAKRDGVLAIVGYKEWHIGNVVYPYLFKAGAFKIIRDQETNMFRVFRPWVPQDAARKDEAKPAPPLIPNRYIKKIVWKDRAKQVFSNVWLTTGWEIKAFSSTAKPEQGYEADLFHIDEDIINALWYDEAMGRLVDRDGLLRWSALPHDENDAIARFAERAETQQEVHEAGGAEPTTIVVRSGIENNPFLDAKAKKAAIAGWKSMGEDVYRKRALGELVTDSVLMYPMFRRGLHSIEAYAETLPDADRYLEKRSPPIDWCLRLAVDPGHTTGAALLIATPPSERFHVIFDEIYIHSCTSKLLVDQIERATRSRQQFQSFLIDAHGGNLTSFDTGISPRESYEERLAEQFVSCVDTGSRFTPGCSVVAYREETMRGMLSVMGDGVPKILYDPETCPNFDREMRRFRKQKIKNEIIDKGNRRSNTHLIECCEYLAVYLHERKHSYVAPKRNTSQQTAGERRVAAFHRRSKMRRQKSMDYGTSSTIILGPQGVMK